MLFIEIAKKNKLELESKISELSSLLTDNSLKLLQIEKFEWEVITYDYFQFLPRLKVIAKLKFLVVSQSFVVCINNKTLKTKNVSEIVNFILGNKLCQK